MPFFACKLPNGLEIRHAGKSLILHGSNIGEDLENVSKNGSPNDNRARVNGFGITELSDDDAKTFTDWANLVTYKNGNPGDGKLDEPFPALENGSIQGPFKSFDEARKETNVLGDSVKTGVEGLDAEAEAKKADGVKPDDSAGKNSRK